jgi:MFS family permease
MFGTFFFLTQYQQHVERFGPLRAGVGFLPLAVGQIAAARSTPVLLAKVGSRPPMLAGAVMLVAALGWLSRLTVDAGYVAGLLGPMILFGVGVGLIFMPVNVAVMAGVGRDAGAASGLMQALQQVGAGVGLAALVTVFGGATGQVANPDQVALTHGMATAFGVAVVFAAVAGVVGVASIRIPARTG